jgi:hypothetical protein
MSNLILPPIFFFRPLVKLKFVLKIFLKINNNKIYRKMESKLDYLLENMMQQEKVIGASLSDNKLGFSYGSK